MHDSPRLRRLRNDLASLERLRDESSVFDFRPQGSPPNVYRIRFNGRGLYRDGGRVKATTVHEVEIKLGTSYPRSIPEIRWLSPIYHPNISEIGMVCLGGYGTHWVPSVQLDELCTMLWDMVRYHNFDVRSPYNRDAALWAGNQAAVPFPTDPRPIRDLRESRGRIEEAGPTRPDAAAAARHRQAGETTLARVGRLLAWRGRGDEAAPAPAPEAPGSTRPPAEEVVILESHVDAAIVGEEPAPAGPPAPAPAPGDILFID